MIYLIGVGIGGKSSLSQRPIRLIENAKILVGGRRHINAFPEFTGKKVVICSDLDRIMKVLENGVKSTARGSGDIVVLATGDPNFFGIAEIIVKRFGKEIVEIIPNVSAMQEAFARIRENWNNARFLSLHGRDADLDKVADEISRHDKIGVFTDEKNNPQMIAKVLLERGIKGYRVHVLEELGGKKERVSEGTLSDISKMNFSPLNVMILLKRRKDDPLIQQKRPDSESETLSLPLGIPDSEFSYSRGMITKEEIRVLTLSKLRLYQRSILWDIGAGCGSLSIEAALILKHGKVIAIEREKEQVCHIRKNKEKFAIDNIEVIHGDALHCLSGLSEPHAVFIGGGGKEVAGILELSYRRVRRGGRIVVNAVTIETLAKAADFFKRERWNMEVISVNIAKTCGRVAEGYQGEINIFNAHNPIFIVVGEKP